MLELSDWDFNMIMINMLKDLVGEVDNIHEEKEIFNREMKTLESNANTKIKNIRDEELPCWLISRTEQG